MKRLALQATNAIQLVWTYD